MHYLVSAFFFLFVIIYDSSKNNYNSFRLIVYFIK